MAIYNVNKTTGDITETAGRYGEGDYTEISYDDWLELTPQEQATGKWDVTGVPGADGTISIDLMTKLWENPSPSESFVAQNIDVSIANYDMIMILARWTKGELSMQGFIGKVGGSIIINFGLPSASGSRTASRYVSLFVNTRVSFDNALDTIGTTASSTNNDRCIPIAIYGIKTTASVKINAIAMDVSTSADKCMLNDGVTSVEDRLENPLAVDSVTNYSNYQHITLMSSGTATSESITLTDDCIVIAVVTGAGTHSVYYGKPTANIIMLYPGVNQTDITMMALSKNTIITGNASGNGSCVSVVAIPLAKLLKLSS